MTTHTAKTHRKGARITGIVLGSLAAVIAIPVIVILVAGGILAPSTYLDPWSRTYSEKFDDPRVQLVAQAVLAPSSHNEQPWRVRLDDTDENVLYLYADSTRLTPEVDPLARQTMISQGTFLEYLTVAGAKEGTAVNVEMFPDGEYDEADLATSMDRLPVAKIVLSPDTTPDDTDYASLFLSDTNRSPYTATAVTTEQAGALEDLSTPASSLLVYRGGDDVAAIGDATIRGTVIESQNSAVAAESADVFRPNEYSKNETRSGFAVEGQGTSGFMKYVLQGLTTILPGTNSPAAAAERDIALTTNGAAATPAYVVLQTTGNSRAEQVQAGMLYAELSLRARTLGLVMQPVSQVLEEYPTMSAERIAIHDAYAPEGGTIQMLVRLGTATIDYPPTMRRDVNELMTGL